jgi:hypothetical protein
MAGSILTAFFALAVMVALIVPIALYFAWAATHLWGWFIVPTFGAPPLTVLQAWGICLTLAMLKPRIDWKKTGGEVDLANGFLAVLLGPLLALALGYAIRFWWM